MKNILYALLFSVLSSSLLHGMFLSKLSKIEKLLVQKEIQKNGIVAVRKKVEDTPEPTPIQDGFKPGYRIEAALTIEDVFHKSDIQTNPLTQAIFNKIEKIEKKSGYIPQQIIEDKPNGYFVTLASNRLGGGTRYYWLEENGEHVPAVRVEAKLYNKKALLELMLQKI